MLSFRQKPKYLIVGLGNPGREYRLTRHNVGFMAVDYLAQTAKADIRKLKFHALTGNAVIAGVPVLLMMPQTFMNLSGEAVGEAARFYKLPPERVIVIFDDADLPLGTLRVREKGSSGGHNGIKSIIAHLGSEEFPRVKIGIGPKPHPEMELADFVLQAFTAADQKVLFDRFSRVAEGVELILKGDVRLAQSRINS
ncbi:MAG TPA: aminoacyl-tRNA hydrolase [Candidatus Acidoferrum sp.]|nr:aminoacyl-tRNA hydrolase [Candidatus Acidoferrum sp.]